MKCVFVNGYVYCNYDNLPFPCLADPIGLGNVSGRYSGLTSGAILVCMLNTQPGTAYIFPRLSKKEVYRQHPLLELP